MKHFPFLKSYKTMKVQCLMDALVVTFDTSLTTKNHVYLVLAYSSHSTHGDISAFTNVKLQPHGGNIFNCSY